MSNEEKYKELISDFETFLHWERIKELLPEDLEAMLIQGIIELLVKTGLAEVKYEKAARECEYLQAELEEFQRQYKALKDGGTYE
jgi:hypothetical protein